MSHTQTWDKAFPDNDQKFGLHASFLRDMKRDYEERMDLNHYISSAVDTTLPEADGYHKQIDMKALSADPTATAPGIIYTKTVSGITVPKYVNPTSNWTFGREKAYLSGDGYDFREASYAYYGSYAIASDSFIYINFDEQSVSAISVSTDDNSIINLPAGDKVLIISSDQEWARYLSKERYYTRQGQIDLQNIIMTNVNSGVDSTFTSHFVKTDAISLKIKLRCSPVTIYPDSGFWDNIFFRISNIKLEITML